MKNLRSSLFAIRYRLSTICYLLFAICSLSGCNYRILSEIRSIRATMATKAQVSKLDSLYNFNQIKLYDYEKIRLDSAYNNISDDDLLRRIRTINRRKN